MHHLHFSSKLEHVRRDLFRPRFTRSSRGSVTTAVIHPCGMQLDRDIFTNVSRIIMFI